MNDTTTILIVEDEPPLAELERIALEGADFRIEEVRCGQPGLDLIDEGEISLVLLDYKLPDITGLDFLEALGERVDTLPVIVVTGYADAKIAIDMLKAGAADYVIKDTELLFLQQLPKTVQDALERYELKRQNLLARERIESQARSLSTQATALEEARARADSANAAKSQFLTHLSHEVRTPMTAILAFTDLLLQDDYVLGAPAARIQDLMAIRDNGNYLLELLNDLLDLSKIETGDLVVERRRFTLSEFLDNILSWMRLRAENKGLDLKVELQGPIPETVETDPVRLRQILVNLVGNAIKFTETGGVRLEVGLDDGESEPRLQINVVDTGIGMTEAVTARLFEPFSQMDSVGSRRFGGSGLGLSLCHRLVTRLGGEISVQSQVGEGSSFALSVPVGSLEGVPRVRELSGSISQVPSSEKLANKIAGRFLLAEDNPINRVITTSILQAAGAEVTVAEDGKMAMQLALEAETERPFDLILMDLQMPNLDGYEATRRLRAEGFRRPILALSAHAMVDHHQQSLEAGCDGHLTKPIDRDRLLDAIAAFL